MNKNVSFEVMLGNALLATGKSQWDVDENNNIVLSAEDEQKITANWGEKYLAKLKPHLNSKTEPKAEEVEDLRVSMHEFQQAEIKKQVDAAKAEYDAKISEKENELATLREKALKLAKDNAILSEQDEVLPKGQVTEFFPARAKKEKGAHIMQVNMGAEHYAAIQKAAASGYPTMSSNANIDVADLRKEFGTYLSQQGNNLDLYVDIMADFTTGKEMTPVMAITEYKAVQALTTSVLQQFTPQWTSKNRTAFKPLTITNRRLKLNAKVTPAQVLDSYMLYLYDERLAPDQMPITKYILENIIKPAILDDLEMRCVAKGRYVEPEYDADGNQITGLLPEDSMDGFETILADNLKNAKSGINYYKDAKTLAELSAMTPDEGLRWISNFASFIAPNMKSKIAKIFCSTEMLTLFNQWQEQYWAKGSGLQNTEFGARRIDFTKFQLTALDSMYGSPILFATPKENFVMLRYRNEVPNIINDVQKHDYDVKFFGEFWFAPGFAIANAVFASVPEGYDPKATINENFNAADQYKGFKTEQNAVINLTSAVGTDAQTVAEGEKITPVTYAFRGDSASVAWGTVPAGIDAVVTGNTVVIAGTPTAAGTYTYTLTAKGVRNASDATATGTITVVGGS